MKHPSIYLALLAPVLIGQAAAERILHHELGFNDIHIPDAVFEHYHSNVRATGRERAQIDAWKHEAVTVRALRDDRAPHVVAALRQLALRACHHIWDLGRYRSAYRLRCSLKSDASLLRKMPCILRARRGESVHRRALRYARADLQRSKRIA